MTRRTTEAAIALGAEAMAWCLDHGLLEGWSSATEEQREAMAAGARSAYEASVGPVVEKPIEVVVQSAPAPVVTEPPATVEPVAGAAPVEGAAEG